MSVSGQNEEQTVIPQRDHDDDQNMVGQTTVTKYLKVIEPGGRSTE